MPKIVKNIMKEIKDYFNKMKDEDYLAFDTHPLSSIQDLLDPDKPAPWDHLTNVEGDEDIDVKSVTGDLNNFEIELEDGRVAEFSYGDSRAVTHTINKHDMTYSADSPLRTMFEFLFSNAGDYELNRKMTLNAIKLSEIVKKKLYPKVLVVGCGIFGTTASVALATSGFKVTLHEELNGIMKCASDINQYRLHKG